MVGLYFPVAAIGSQILLTIFVIGVLWMLYKISSSLQCLVEAMEKKQTK
ncbi:MAG: hypothetical protein H6Q74_646 [Firmicutes bacterium]|nr:hypothetical protein [Bacillota bacterium]